jgi:hypothetical protein
MEGKLELVVVAVVDANVDALDHVNEVGLGDERFAGAIEHPGGVEYSRRE